MLHYRVENSEDLVTWDTLIITTGTTSSFVEFNGTGQPWNLPLVTTGIPRQFYRFVLDQPDDDGDGLPNWLELLIGTNPYQWDTDGDGIPDGGERTFNLNPLYSGDANATAAGGGITNAQHYQNGSNSNNPPPLATIVPGTAVTEQDASTAIYPANEAGLLIQNGNFSTPTIATGSTYGFFTASATTTQWTPIFGTFIELQNSSANGTSGQYCELAAHWHDDTNPNHTNPSDPDHGIQQTVNLNRGNYLLIFDYRARQEVPGGHISGEFTASAQVAGGTAVPLVVNTGTNSATTTWKRAYAPFEVKGGNPNNPQVGVTIQFDYAGTRYKAQSPFIDNVMLVETNLGIWNGQDANTPVPNDQKFSLGAFTVANLNDTDGNGTPDNTQTPVPGEKDLMQLHVAGYKGLSGKAKISIRRGTVKFWGTKTKNTGTEIALTNGAVFFDIPVEGLHKTLWVEATAVSNTLRDIEIWAGFQDANGILADGADKVQATAVWAAHVPTSLKTSGNQLWGDCQNPLATTFTTEVKTFGKKITPSDTLGPIYHIIGFEFNVQPPGIGGELGVKFDLTRQKQYQSWGVVDGVVKEDLPYHPFPTGDLADDDTGFLGESQKPKNDYIYSFDQPGFSNNLIQKWRDPAHPTDPEKPMTQLIRRINFWEYVRVGFDGHRPEGNTAEGSRCSDKVPWHAFFWLVDQGIFYGERSDKPNNFGLNHGAIGPEPVP